jgi:hypothetical protein
MDEVTTQAVTTPVPAAGSTTTTTGAIPATMPAAAPAVATVVAGAGGDDEAMSLDEARKLRREAQTLRKRLTDFEDRDKAAQAAALTDAEKLQKRLAELELAHATAQKTHLERVVRYEVMLKASALGVVDPDAAVKLLDWPALEFDDEGQPKNTEAVLKALLKAKPYLLKPAPGAQGNGSAPNINAGASGTSEATTKAHDEELRKRFRL